jgi:hypothetical protein
LPLPGRPRQVNADGARRAERERHRTCNLATADLQIAFDGEGFVTPKASPWPARLGKSGNAGMALALLGLDASPSADVPLELRADVVKTTGGIEFKSISGEIWALVEESASFDTSGDKTRFRVAADAARFRCPLCSARSSLGSARLRPRMLGSLPKTSASMARARLRAEPLRAQKARLR